ncbi:hypothetical protein I6N90_05995 [Paenibacillus sp. GSMTC-2017]|uniref:hypothetical protein n=1 Tax=Paenibacillus sp. GSMTC-2017 TaxID=2794350 RepID=UPI0018DA11BC|nr:hypothetical protein [Paenibacillus sp. GSMTC-2017]MBH5317364.1 hypothetical protein [Paenibacillus sp. GSMTC-2017]
MSPLSSASLQVALSTHIQDVMMPFVLDVLDNLGYTDIHFETSTLPNISLTLTEYIQQLNTSWKCTLFVNSQFAFEYGLFYEMNNGLLKESYWIKGKQEKCSLSTAILGTQNLQPWSIMKESIHYRLVCHIEGTIPHIRYATRLLKVFFEHIEVRFIDLDHNYYYFRCSESSKNHFIVKICEIGSILRQDIKNADKYHYIGQLELFILFSATRMKMLIEQDHYLHAIYESKMNAYRNHYDAEYRTLELLFYSFVIKDAVMTAQYKAISGSDISTEVP